MSATLLTLSSERSRHDCAVAKNSNADRISELCFIACPQIGVLWSSDDTLCNFTWGLSPQRRWEHARQNASRHSASLPVHEMVFCSLLMTLSSATSHWDFLLGNNVVGRMLPVCAVKPNRALSAKGRLRSCRPDSPHGMTVLLRRTPTQTAFRNSAPLPVHELIQTKTTHQRLQHRARDTSSSSLPPQRPQNVVYAV